MKKFLIIWVVSFASFGAFSQTKISEHNLPPGSVLKPKTDTNIDYSYKLSEIPPQSPQNAIYDDFLKDWSAEDLEITKNKEPKLYAYLIEAQNYHNALSDKVKVTFSFDELWYIYVFDQELKNELLRIR